MFFKTFKYLVIISLASKKHLAAAMHAIFSVRKIIERFIKAE